MRKLALLAASLLLCVSVAGKDTPACPRILGIAGVRLFVSSMDSAGPFYARLLGHGPCNWCETPPSKSGIVPVNPTQMLMLSADAATGPQAPIAEITFRTDNLRQLRKYLAALQLVPSKMKNPDSSLTLMDPEGNQIRFVQSAGPAIPPLSIASGAGQHLARIGLIVRNRDAANHFYKDVLGFRLSQQCPVAAGPRERLDLQVPDGTDCLTYELTPSDPATSRTSRITFAVTNIRDAVERLHDEGVLPSLDIASVGADGKLSFQVRDPDGTPLQFVELAVAPIHASRARSGPLLKP